MSVPYDPDRYLVLRIDSALPSGVSRLQSMYALRPDIIDELRATPPKLTLETTTLTDKQRFGVVRDPKQEAAPIIPTTLVAPVATADEDAEAALQSAKAAGASWGVLAVKATYAISATRPPERDIAVAVLDTGIDKTHPAFRGIKDKNWHCENFLEPRCDGSPNIDVSDTNGHGTHCASTIFGQDVDGVRIGVAPGVSTAVIAKVLDKNGRGSNETISKALRWAADQDARIISMSLGFDFAAIVDQLKAASWPERAAVSKALQAYRDNVRYFDKLIDFLSFDGRLIVAAAGNESKRGLPQSDQLVDVNMPAATANVISVGALRRTNGGFSVASFSNINPVLSAPGVDIVGAKLGGGLVSMSGTSMACPHVAGLAALWWDSQLAQMGQTSADEVHASLRALAANVNLRLADQGRGLAVGPT